MTGSSHVASALNTPTPTSSSPASRQSSGSWRSQRRPGAARCATGLDDGHPHHDEDARRGHEREPGVGGEQQPQAPGGDEGLAPEGPDEDPDELRGAADGDGHGPLTRREAAGGHGGRRREDERLRHRGQELARELPAVARGVDEPDERPREGEDGTGGERRVEGPVDEPACGEGEHDEQQGVDDGEVTDEALAHPERLGRLGRHRGEGQPEHLGGGHEQRERREQGPPRRPWGHRHPRSVASRGAGVPPVGAVG